MVIHLCDRCHAPYAGGLASWVVTLQPQDAADPKADKDRPIPADFVLNVQATVRADLCGTCFQSAIKIAAGLDLPAVSG